MHGYSDFILTWKGILAKRGTHQGTLGFVWLKRNKGSTLVNAMIAVAL
jgi:hypothetical protein